MRVDVTADQGKTWHVAELQQDTDKHSRHWGWTLWTLNVPVTPGAKQVRKLLQADSVANTNKHNTAVNSLADLCLK